MDELADETKSSGLEIDSFKKFCLPTNGKELEITNDTVQGTSTDVEVVDGQEGHSYTNARLCWNCLLCSKIKRILHCMIMMELIGSTQQVMLKKNCFNSCKMTQKKQWTF